MKTFEEIQDDVRQATDISDAEALLRYAAELDAIATPQAEALASRSRGVALHLRGDSPAALEHLHRALAIFKELGNLSGVASVTVDIGIKLWNTDDYAAALGHYHRALALYEEIGNRSGVATVTGNIGNVHNSTGDYPVALEYYHRALALHEDLSDRSGVARVTGNIGNVHQNTGDYPAALEHQHRALALYVELDNRSGVARVTGNIGNVYQTTCDYPAALEYHHRALALHEELGERSGVAIGIGNIGNVHRSTGDYHAALEHYHRALALHKELGDRSGEARVTGNIGNAYSSAGDYPVALDHYHRALALYEELGSQRGVAGVTSNIVETYLSMGSDMEAIALLVTMDAMQIDIPELRISREQHRAILLERSGDLDAATAILQRALLEAHYHNLRSYAADIHRALRDLAQKRNDFTAYIEHNNEYTRITEEINGRETATKLAMQAKQREIDAKDREHAQHLAVLHSTLPKHIADRVARGEVVNDHYDNASVIFLDIVGFTDLSSSMSSQDVIILLDNIFTQCDAICEQYNVTKIKTIGDSYMAVAFETANTEQRTAISVVRAANAAIEMMNVTLNEELTKALEKALNKPIIEFRIGIHCGPVTAGVIGTQRMQYDVWGDTVNVASRMESTSEPGKIHVSEALANALNEALNEAHIVPRGEIEVKGKGMMKTYWLEGL